MNVNLEIGGKEYIAELNKPIDISIPLRNTQGPKAFYAPDYKSFPVKTDSFIGSIKEGGIVNFFNIHVNPHGNGTHTECVGHISNESQSINDCLKQFHFTAVLISVTPDILENGDRIIMPDCLDKHKEVLSQVDALVMRTFPNDDSKINRDYSGSNPPYVHHETMKLMNDCGIRHFLLDLPSVDREEDGAKFLAHKEFWKYPLQTDVTKTITEMIYVDNDIEDGLYLLNIQIGSYELDASPSKPLLFKLVSNE